MRTARPHSLLLNALAVSVSSILTIAASSYGAAASTLATNGSFTLHPGLELSLFASEPDVVDPVALCFDEHGRVFVVEMRDYPYGIGPDRKPGGTIRLLEDRNGDGHIDRSTVFAEALSFPTSVAPWDGGIIVTAPPEVIFLKDDDGDGRADTREVLLRGFRLGVTDSNVNGLRWGLDNRLHGVNGGNGGNIVSTRKPGAALPLRNHDFSFAPETGDLVATFQTSGGFGLVFDDWGRSFVTYNIDHFQHRIIPFRYLQRFGGFPPVEVTLSISDHGEMARIFPVSTPETRVNHPEQSGHFSSAGGMGYLGVPGFPGDLTGSVFVCDVVGNLVHRDVLHADGPIFTAKRSPMEQTNEFFASRDNSFRPVGLELGPDGALYLIDMQRDVIEHPDYIPAKVRDKLDLRAGENRGRIYRIAPRGNRLQPLPRLHTRSPTELVGLLSHANQWWRTTAQRLIVSRHATNAAPELRRMLADAHPLASLHAMWTLHGLGILNERDIIGVLSHRPAGLRENALQLAETLLPASARLNNAIIAAADDSDARVRFQAALTLGDIDTPDARRALHRIAHRDYAHRWSRIAVLSSLRDGEIDLLAELVAKATSGTSIDHNLIDACRELADLKGARVNGDSRRLEAALKLPGQRKIPEPLRIALLDGFHSGLSRNGKSTAITPAIQSAVEALSADGSTALLAAAWKLSKHLGLPETTSQQAALSNAASRVRDARRSEAERLADVRLLALGSYSIAGEPLCALLDGATATGVQTAAIDALRQFREPALATNLVRRWRTLGATARVPVINLLLQRTAFHGALLDALESGHIRVGELNLDLEQRRRLLRNSTAGIKQRAARFFSDEEYSNRKSLVDEWLQKLPASGDAARGRVVFEKVCASCHAFGGTGTAVGPDLGALAHRSVEDLVSNILDPNMAINPSYISYTVETSDGELHTGIPQTESAESVVLLQAMGQKVTLPRASILRLESSGLSLMPEGLEGGMTAAELRDLIAFLQQSR